MKTERRRKNIPTDVPLLTGGVPNLGLDGFMIDQESLGLEFNADGRLGIKAEIVSGKSSKKLGFSDG